MELILAEGELAPVRLDLEGGIVGVTTTGPRGEKRPLWVIDLGHGAILPYPVGGMGAGKYTIKVTSYERERPARVTVETAPPLKSSETLSKLQIAEDDLANGELARRHWPNAIAGLNAQDAFERAFAKAEEIGMVPLERLALTQEARLLIFSRGQFLPARALLVRAAALPASDDDSVQALTWKTLSSVHYDLGEFRAAIDDGEKASALYRKTNDLYWQGIVLGNLAADYSELGLENEALAAAREALDDAKKEHDPAGVVYCLSQLAGLYSQRGELESAFRSYFEGIQWVSSIGYAPLVEAEIEKDLGVFSVQMGDWGQAGRALRRALEIEGHREDPVTLEAEGAMAAVLRHENKSALALERANSAIGIAHRLKLQSDQANLLLNRAEIKRALGRTADRIGDLEEADRIARELGSLTLRMRVEQALGDAQFNDHPEVAEAKYRQVLEWAQQTGEREQQAEAMVGLAHAQRIKGHTEDALQSVDSALDILDQADRSLSSIDLQASYFHLHRSWYELAIDLCMDLNRDHPEGGYRERAFSYSERAHARALFATLRHSTYDPEDGMTEEMRVTYARNRHAIEAEESKLMRTSDEERAATLENLQQLYRNREGIEAQVQSSDRRLHSLLVDQTTDVAKVQKELLPAGAVLVSYWIGEAASYRWTITAHSFKVTRLPPRAQLEAQIVPLEAQLENGHPVALPGETAQTYVQRQMKLAAQLQLRLSRAGSLLLSELPAATHSLLVVRDGCLISLSFAALRVPSAKGRQKYVVERYSIKVEPSASVAIYLRHHPPAGERSSIAVIADPILSSQDSRAEAIAVASRQKGNQFATLPRLTGSEREAQQIVHLAKPHSVVLLTGFDANPAVVEELSFARLSILHFATHTISFRNHPEISGISLSMFDKKGHPRDGVLWARDIDRLRIPVPLVVLSGCDTEGVQDGAGERIDSLSYAFFFAGVRSVVASLWNVDDDATSELMQHFYRQTLKGVTADEALRRAQLEVMGQGASRSPSTWAPFVMEGWPQAFVAQPTTKVSGRNLIGTTRR